MLRERERESKDGRPSRGWLLCSMPWPIHSPMPHLLLPLVLRCQLSLSRWLNLCKSYWEEKEKGLVLFGSWENVLSLKIGIATIFCCFERREDIKVLIYCVVFCFWKWTHNCKPLVAGSVCFLRKYREKEHNHMVHILWFLDLNFVQCTQGRKSRKICFSGVRKMT